MFNIRKVLIWRKNGTVDMEMFMFISRFRIVCVLSIRLKRAYLNRFIAKMGLTPLLAVMSDSNFLGRLPLVILLINLYKIIVSRQKTSAKKCVF